MSVHDGRQVASTLKGIRADHRHRYSFAAHFLPPVSRILDCACGVGYGSWMLAEAGHHVTGFDAARDAIDFARRNWVHPRAEYRRGNLLDCELPMADAVISFETIEHVAEPRPMLQRFTDVAPCIMASVPNEAVVPWTKANRHHVRHYTREQFGELLEQAGWKPMRWWTQSEKAGEVRDGRDGATIIVMADRA